MAERRSQQVLYLGSAIFLAVIVGMSRVYLGVHYPTDVIAGWSIGAGWALAWTLAAHLVRERMKTKA